MGKVLIVIDMQNDFVTGTLGNKEAQAIVLNVQAKVKEYADRGDRIIFTRDTHGENYLDTPEGKKLPVKHCINGTEGWQIVPGLDVFESICTLLFMAFKSSICVNDKAESVFTTNTFCCLYKALPTLSGTMIKNPFPFPYDSCCIKSSLYIPPK